MTAYEVIQKLKKGPSEAWIETYKALRTGETIIEESSPTSNLESDTLIEYIEQYAMGKPELKEILEFKIKKEIDDECTWREVLLKSSHNHIRNKKPGLFVKIKMFFKVEKKPAIECHKAIECKEKFAEYVLDLLKTAEKANVNTKSEVGYNAALIYKTIFGQSEV